jgi:hypothetical protein
MTSRSILVAPRATIALTGRPMKQMACLIARGSVALAIACAVVPAGAAQPAAPAAAASSSADAAYERDRANCAKDATPQGRTTCLKEAGAVHAEAKRKALGNGEDARALAENAELRCKNVATAERDACLRMARGEGKVSGSVDGGGVLKTLVTPISSPAPAASR